MARLQTEVVQAEAQSASPVAPVAPVAPMSLKPLKPSSRHPVKKAMNLSANPLKGVKWERRGEVTGSAEVPQPPSVSQASVVVPSPLKIRQSEASQEPTPMEAPSVSPVNQSDDVGVTGRSDG